MSSVHHMVDKTSNTKEKERDFKMRKRLSAIEFIIIMTCSIAPAPAINKTLMMLFKKGEKNE